jgi:DNA-binding CsgD family transcriptional regulator
VKGSNNDGVWSEPGTSLKIIITPPFWQTWWFRTLCVVMLLAFLFAWHQKRMKYLSLRLKTEAEMGRIFEKHNISDREKQIVYLILKGKSNKEIEDILYISIKTVKNHVYSIYQKFGVNNRLELIHLIQQSVKAG